MTSDGVAGLFARQFARVRSGGSRVGGRLSPSPPASPTGHSGTSTTSSLLPRFLSLGISSVDASAAAVSPAPGGGGTSPLASAEVLESGGGGGGGACGAGVSNGGGGVGGGGAVTGSAAGVVTPAVGAAYVEDPRDDTDELAPPAHLRADAWRKLGETYDRRHAGVAAMHALIRKHERGDDGGGVGASAGHPPPGVSPAATAVLGAAATAPCTYSRREDSFLLAFLRCKKFDTARAFDEYTNYSRFHDEYGWLRSTQRDLVRRLLTSGSFSILPTRDPDGRVILSVVTRHLLALVDDVGAANVTSILKAVLFLLEVMIADVEAQIYGAVIVQNLEGYALRYVRYMKASEYRLFLHLCQDCYPLRANAMYAINEPLVLRTVWAIVRPFMKAKVKRRFKTFGASYSVLYDHIPRESLTADFGGTLRFDANAAASRWIAAVDAANGLTQSP